MLQIQSWRTLLRRCFCVGPTFGPILAGLLAGALAACASLPDYRPLLIQHAAAPVAIVGKHHTLSPNESRALLNRLGDDRIEGSLRDHLAFVQELSGAPLVAGNDVQLLVDGPDAYAAMLRAITKARDHINLETFIFRDDALGRRLADALVRKQREGVQVNVIYDSVGSFTTPREFFEGLRQTGVAVLEFNPLNSAARRPGAPNQAITDRDHRKLLIVDGRIAFTGGINVQNAYGKSSAVSGGKATDAPNLDEGWRDTQIAVRGPAVAGFQRLFMTTWQTQGGPPLAPRDYFPTIGRAGRQIVQVIGSGPQDRQSVIYLTLLSAIAHAEKSIHLTSAYFVPDRQFLDALIAARARGVDVQLVLPGISDHPLVLAAGHAHYEDLLEAGVVIYERRDVMLHAKTAVIDGVWSTVGSANMDLCSFLYNEEINAVVLSADFGRRMETMFRGDVAAAVRVDRAQWANRPVGERTWELFARLWESVL